MYHGSFCDTEDILYMSVKTANLAPTADRYILKWPIIIHVIRNSNGNSSTTVSFSPQYTNWPLWPMGF